MPELVVREDPPAPPSLVSIRAEIQERETRLATLRLRERLGELVDRRKFDAAMAALGTRHRDALLALPVRVAPALAAEFGTPGRVMTAALERMIRSELTEIAAAARAQAAE